MVKTTIIARVNDGLPLVASMDDDENEDLTEYKNLAKQLFRRLSSAGNAEESRCSIEAGTYVFHYMIEYDVCYLTLCDKTYPKKLAFSYLEELQKEFQEQHGSEVQTAARPYSCIKFDNVIQKIKRQYKDTRTQRNMTKLNEDLQDVARIMTRNIQDVLGRQEMLDEMSTISSRIKEDSKKYLKDAKHLNLQMLYRKYGPPAIIISVILLVFYLRIYWF